jgi:hypothetical protein
MGRGPPNNVLKIGNAARLVRLLDTIHLGVEGADLIPEPFDHFRVLTISGVTGINPPFSHFVLHHTRGVDERTMLPNFLVHLLTVLDQFRLLGLIPRLQFIDGTRTRRLPKPCSISRCLSALLLNPRNISSLSKLL